jgi:hypothetical protein
MLLMNKCIGTIARMGGTPAVLYPFVDSLVDMVQWNAQYLCQAGEYVHYPRPPRVSIHDVARNLIAENMRGDWVLMLDTDHSFDPDLAFRLMTVAERTGADVVTGVYQYKDAPHSPVIFRQQEDGLYPIGGWDEKVDILEIDSAGGGCLWIKRSVFERISSELDEQPFARIAGYGEDHSFFLRLKKLNIKFVCAMNVESHHLQIRPLSMKDYDRESIELQEATMAVGYNTLG